LCKTIAAGNYKKQQRLCAFRKIPIGLVNFLIKTVVVFAGNIENEERYFRGKKTAVAFFSTTFIYAFILFVIAFLLMHVPV
jgi:hypothetical protein